jgi:hypothetical protein
MPVLMFESLLDMLRRDMALGGRRVRHFSVGHPNTYQIEVRVTWDDPKLRPTVYVFDAKSGRLREARQER